MSSITTDDITKLARLSSLEMSPEASEAFRHELEEILSFVRQLDEVDTTGLEPTYQVNGLTNVSREDVIIDYGLGRDELIANAPATLDGQVQVPRVLG